MDHGLLVFVFWIPQIPGASEVGMRRLRSHPRCFTANYHCGGEWNMAIFVYLPLGC